MEYGAIDLHKRRSQVRIVAEDGAVQWTGRIDTTRAALSGVWAARAPMRILVGRPAFGGPGPSGAGGRS
jgi:hypothetical protein